LHQLKKVEKINSIDDRIKESFIKEWTEPADKESYEAFTEKQESKSTKTQKSTH
jgi:hypothetical protein